MPSSLKHVFTNVPSQVFRVTGCPVTRHLVCMTPELYESSGQFTVQDAFAAIGYEDTQRDDLLTSASVSQCEVDRRVVLNSYGSRREDRIGLVGTASTWRGCQRQRHPKSRNESDVGSSRTSEPHGSPRNRSNPRLAPASAASRNTSLTVKQISIRFCRGFHIIWPAALSLAPLALL